MSERHSWKYFFALFVIPLYCLLQSHLPSGGEEDDRVNIYVVSHGWHTGLVVPARCLPDTLFPPHIALLQETFLEIGWGDRDFYQNPEFNLWQAIKAALVPTASVLHVVGFSKPVGDYFLASEVIELSVSAAQFQRLCAFIASEFARDSLNRAIALGPGIYGHSQFFKGKSKYYFPKTCNVWTAKALKVAGFDIQPLQYQRAGTLMKRLRKYGRVVNQPEY